MWWKGRDLAGSTDERSGAHLFTRVRRSTDNHRNIINYRLHVMLARRITILLSLVAFTLTMAVGFMGAHSASMQKELDSQKELIESIHEYNINLQTQLSAQYHVYPVPDSVLSRYHSLFTDTTVYVGRQ